MTAIALFGATGKTGRRTLSRLLEQGFQVRALARDPDQLTPAPGLTIIPGDVLDEDAVERVLEGSDAVLSVFGQVKGSPAWLQTRGTSQIVEAMRRHDVTRIVSLSGGGLPAPQDRPGVPDRIIRLLLRLLSAQVLRDAQGHLEVLQNSQTDWTVVRGPRLTEAPGRGRYRVGWVGVDASTQISRDDLADFLVTQIDDSTFVGQLPFVSW